MNREARLDLEKFQAELVALCKRHGVQLGISMQGDLEVWPEELGGREFNFDLIDMTLPEAER